MSYTPVPDPTDPADPTDVASAFAAMCDAVDDGDLETAISLSEEFAIPLDTVWAPEDDCLEPTANPGRVNPDTSAGAPEGAPNSQGDASQPLP